MSALDEVPGLTVYGLRCGELGDKVGEAHDFVLASDYAALRVELQAARELGESWRNLANEADDRVQAAEAALQAAQEALRKIAEIDVDLLGSSVARQIVWQARAVLVEGACGRGVEALLDSDDFAILNEETQSAAVEGERTDGPLLTGKHPRDVGNSTWALDAENDGRNPGGACAPGGEGTDA